eukprot:12968993-Alexandrium_andersonii.AAC.1
MPFGAFQRAVVGRTAPESAWSGRPPGWLKAFWRSAVGGPAPPEQRQQQPSTTSPRDSGDHVG